MAKYGLHTVWVSLATVVQTHSQVQLPRSKCTHSIYIYMYTYIISILYTGVNVDTKIQPKLPTATTHKRGMSNARISTNDLIPDDDKADHIYTILRLLEQ